MAGFQVSLEMQRDRVLVFGDEYPFLSLDPQQDHRVIAAERKIPRLTHAHDVQRVNPVLVVPL